MSLETGKRPPKTQNVDAQNTFTLEIAVGTRKLSRKTASNLQRGKYQNLIRGSLNDIFSLKERKAQCNKVLRHVTAYAFIQWA